MLNLEVTIGNMKFAQFLELKFLEWQQQEGGRKTVKEFASYIGVSQSSISMWWNGDRTPEGETVQKIAQKLGIETYDVLGAMRPDEDLLYIQSLWDDLSPKAHQALREQAETYREKNEQKRVKKPRPSHNQT